MILLLMGAAWAATLSGTVRERGTGDPVVGATLVDAGGQTVGSSGPRGEFKITLPDGAVSLQVLGLNHLPATLQLELPTDAPLRVYLERAPGDPEVVVESRRKSPHLTQRVLDREGVENTPGAHDDPIRLIQSMPGVAMTPEYGPSSGAIAIRGAAPSESKVLLDGIELPYLYHFQQYASILHTRLLDELAVYPSTFGPSYGDAVGGVAAVSTRRPDPSRLHAGFDINAIMGGAFIQAPVAEGWALSASARRSYADLYESGSDQYTSWPAFWDYLARVDRRSGSDDQLSLTAVGAGDAYGRYAGDAAALDPVEQADNPAFSNQRAFHSGILDWAHDGSDATLRSVLGVVWDQRSGDLPGAEEAREELSVEGRQSSALLLSDRFTLAVGGDLRASRLERRAVTDRSWPELQSEAPMLARGLPVNEVLQRIRGGIFVEPRFTLGRLDLRTGLRGQADSATRSLLPEPRVALRYALTDALGLRAGGGRYSQVPTLDDLSPVTGDPDLGPIDSWQAAGGVDLLVSGRWELSLDGWARSLQGAVLSSPGEAPLAQDGRAWGTELVSRYRVRDRFFSWVGLTLGRSLRDGEPFAYDQPWALTVVASWDFRPHWNLGLRYRAAAGLPYTPVEGGLYDGDNDVYTPIMGEPYSARLPTYQKVDLHLARAFEFRRWTLDAYLETWWVPKAANNLYPVYSYDFTEQALVSGPGFVPLIGLRAVL